MATKEKVMGEVTEILPNIQYRVLLKSGVEVIAYPAGRMRVNNIKILVGDYVTVELDPYQGKTSNRIINRSQR